MQNIANWYVWSDTNPGFLGPWSQQVWYPAGDSYLLRHLSGVKCRDLNLANPAGNR